MDYEVIFKIMKHVVLIRHGESEAVRDQKFAGWLDVPLTPLGITQSREMAKILEDSGFDEFDIAFASYLQRSILSTWYVLEELSLLWIPVICHWRLNERHYGGFQGLEKEKVVTQFGWERVHMIRRGYETPPPLDPGDPLHSNHDGRYDSIDISMPVGESLAHVEERVVPYWEKEIRPLVQQGKRVLVATHGNTIRSLLRNISNMSREQIVGIEIPVGIPLILEFEDDLTFSKYFFLKKRVF